jgi:hypothetical protein
MSAVRDLPARPSLDSLRKQAKRLAREAAAGNAAAVARIRAHLPTARLPLSNRNAQFVIASEYGFAGWSELAEAARNRHGDGLERAAGQARAAIHNHDYERLRTLLAEHPALITWRSESGESLLDVTTSYAIDSSDPERDRTYNRPFAAGILIEAGAVVESPTWEHVIRTGSRGMLQLLSEKNVLPRALPILAALGDDAAVREWFDGSDGSATGGVHESRDVVGRALVNACRFGHNALAAFLLERLIARDPDLGHHIDTWHGRRAFVEFLIDHPASAAEWEVQLTPWESFVFRQVVNALDANDLSEFNLWLEKEPRLLQAPFVRLQAAIVERACWQKSRDAFITALLTRNPALLASASPPPSSALAHALSYGNAHLVPLLTRIWPLPDDLPHAAGTGNTEAVARWFDPAGGHRLGAPACHYPGNDPLFKRHDLGWGPVTTQQILDCALAWAVLNRHFEIASFLLERGANINTNWSTHEPASILHEAVIQGNEEAVRFLIDRGGDLTMKDYRYQSNAEGWARYGAGNEPLADFLADAARRNKSS